MTNSFPPNSPSPFQLPPHGNPVQGSYLSAVSPDNTNAFKAKTTPSKTKWLGLLIGISIITGGAFWAHQQGIIPMPWPTLSNQLFIESAGLSKQSAHILYRESLEALKTQQHQQALDGFIKLEKAYPGLVEIIWLHQAEAYAALGEEANAQKRLKDILSHFPKSPLAPKARYLLGQSHLRASENDLAKAAFNQLKTETPHSDYGIGSLYYLGLLSQTQAPTQARNYWLAYLNACPNCRFSGDSAEALQRQIDTNSWKEPLSPKAHLLVGIGLAASDRQWDKALLHLQQAPIEDAWFYMAKAWKAINQPEKSTGILLEGLKTSKDASKSQEAIDWLFRSAKADTLALLEALANTRLPQQGDYLLWKLAQVTPTRAAGYYQQILSQYPTGDYSPESSWNLLWPFLESGQYSAYIAGR